ATGKTKGFKAHGFIGHIAGQNDQVGPGQAVTVFLFNRPQQAAGFIEVGVVGPAVNGGETLVTGTGTTAAIGNAVRTGAVPGHADPYPAVVSPVRWAPVLSLCHQDFQVVFNRVEVDFFKGFGVIEVVAQRVRFAIVLVQDVEVQVIRPPSHVGIAVGGIAT